MKPEQVDTTSSANSPSATHEGRAHARCSASSAERWTSCFGSPAMEALLPPQKASKYAEEGTRAHELAEKLLSPVVFHWNKTQTLHDKVSEIMDFTIHSSYPREMWENVKGYVDLVLEMVSFYKPKKIFLETQVTLFPQLEMFGTADCFFAFKVDDKKVISVWDLKYGKGKVVPASSPQLIYYALAAINKYKVGEFDEAWLNIYQPRAQDDEGAHRQHVVSSSELKVWKDVFFRSGSVAMDLVGKSENRIKKYLKAGDHCGFCAARAICDSHKEYLQEKAGMDFADESLLILPVATENGSSDVLYDIDVNRISAILSVAKEIESYLINVRQVATSLLLSGTEIPGWKVVEGRSTRKWKQDKKTIIEGLKSLGIDNPLDDKLRGLGSIEAELKEKGMKAKEAKEAVSSFVEMSQPSLSLAIIEDPRPAVSGKELAAIDFSEIDSGD